ncbi:MAG TPA: membrane protein insertase YidC [Nevskia sp.]|nr:membrane protein insertase YidC [Nevskia sp.]
MENRRMILVALLGLVLFLMYNAWQADYAARPSPSTAAESGAGGGSSSDAKAASAGATDVSTGVGVTQQHLRVQTDRIVADIALAGGELRKLELSGYAVDKKHPEQTLALLDDRDGQQFTLISGIAGADQPLSSVQTNFTSPQSDYRLADGAAGLDVPMEYTDPSGYTVRKVFHFKRDSYEIGLTQTLINKTGHELQASAYERYLRSPPPPDKGPGFMRTAGSFFGVGIYQQKEGSDSYAYHKTAFKDLDKPDKAIEARQKGGWVVMLQHYFVAAIVPPQDQEVTLSAKKSAGGSYSGLYQAQALGSLQTVADGAEHAFDSKLYIGPVLQGKALEAVGPRFDLVEDYGILSPVAKPLFWVLTQYHKLTGNWGWAIILLTLTVKALFFKLSEAQYRSTAKMKKFGPRIQELRERYGEDRERLNKAMMELYKKEGFNPLAGCWPLLVQMPVFFALYWVLAQSVELRQAPFVLWMQDLSGPDPFYILPVLYGVSMWAQQRISGQSATMDPTQQKIMNIMPIFLTGLFLFFPVGLVLYWLCSNLINILQQLFIARRLEREEQRKAALAK